MKKFIVYSMLILALPSCRDDDASPKEPLSQIHIPEPRVVKRIDIPSPLPEVLYVVRAPAYKGMATSVLHTLLTEGLPLVEAWDSYQSLCMRAYDPPELAVRLSRSDNRMLSYGFVFGERLDGCYFTWKYYRF